MTSSLAGARRSYRRLRAYLGRPRFQIQDRPVILDDQDFCSNPVFLIGVHRSGTSLLRRIVMSMLVDQGVDLKPWADGATVRALKVEQVKAEFFKSYYTDGETAAAKQKAKRVAFQRAVELAVERGTLAVREGDGEGHLWLARAAAAPAPAKDACRR